MFFYVFTFLYTFCWYKILRMQLTQFRLKIYWHVLLFLYTIFFFTSYSNSYELYEMLLHLYVAAIG